MTRRFERFAFVGLLAFAAAIYLVNLSNSGWANAFYSAAVQAGSVNWEAFFFGSSDAANAITVDKPPASLWLMALSVRMLGLSPFAILLPEALMGVATVAVLYLIARRHFPAWTALLAGFALAITPVAALMFRYNNPDALLVLLLTLATFFTLRGVETPRLRWLLLAGSMVGLGFLTKQLQAFLILPVLAGVYLWAAPISLGKRVLHSLAALGAVIVAAGWWVAIVTLTPASARPYIGGSQSNNFLELTFGYNGLGRLTGNETGSVTNGTPHWGGTGLDRLFSGDIGAQVTWLMFAALAMTGIAVWQWWRMPRTDARRAMLLLLSGTMIVTAVAFSLMAGIFHSYYTVAVAPGLAGTFAIGSWLLWTKRAELWSRISMAVIVGGTAAWAWELLYRSDPWLPWLRWVVVGLGAVGAALLLLPRSGRPIRVAAASVALAAVLVGPLAFSLATISQGHQGAVVSAGPGGAGRVTPAFANFRTTALSVHGISTIRPTTGGLLDSSVVTPTIAQTLAEGSSSYTWMAAAIGSNVAAGYQLATGLPVMAVGGFNGSDPAPTFVQFQKLVAEGQIHWFVGGRVGHPNGGSTDSGRIEGWVADSFTQVTIGNLRFYDLTKPLAVVTQ